MRTTDMWSYDSGSDDWTTTDITGYKVQALDGDMGKVDEANRTSGQHSIVVDTGPWILGQKVLLPAGVLTNVDHTNQIVMVNATKDQIKSAPTFDEQTYRDDAYRSDISSYYGTIH